MNIILRYIMPEIMIETISVKPIITKSTVNTNKHNFNSQTVRRNSTFSNCKKR